MITTGVIITIVFALAFLVIRWMRKPSRLDVLLDRHGIVEVLTDSKGVRKFYAKALTFEDIGHLHGIPRLNEPLPDDDTLVVYEITATIDGEPEDMRWLITTTYGPPGTQGERLLAPAQ